MGDSLMSPKCSMCASHPPATLVPGTARDEFVQPQRPGEEFGNGAAAGSPWPEGAGGCDCHLWGGGHHWQRGELSSGSLREPQGAQEPSGSLRKPQGAQGAQEASLRPPESCHLPLHWPGAAPAHLGDREGKKPAPAASGSPRRAGPGRAWAAARSEHRRSRHRFKNSVSAECNRVP